MLFAWSHRHALQLFGFADDLGLMLDLPQRARNGELWTAVWQRIVGPLWGPGSVMWRPLPFASMAIDALLYGTDGKLWRITNLSLHIATAAFAGLISRSLLKQSALPSAVAFAAALLLPWAPETTLWMVGRFDGLASLFVMISLWTAMHGGAQPRWVLFSGLAAVAAYASKESALVLPAWVPLTVCVVALRDRGSSGYFVALTSAHRRHWLLFAVHALLALAYLGWRWYLFGSVSTDVYGASPLFDLADGLARLVRHLNIVIVAAAYAPQAAAIAATLGLLGLITALAGRHRWIALLGCALALSIFAAAAVHFSAALPLADGFRFYYLASLGIAIVVATAVASIRETNYIHLSAIAIVCVALAIWQNKMAGEWRLTSNALKNVVTAIAEMAPRISPSDYGLLLLADPVGHVPASRNAQGALLGYATLTNPVATDEASRLIIFTPPAGRRVVSRSCRRTSFPA